MKVSRRLVRFEVGGKVWLSQWMKKDTVRVAKLIGERLCCSDLVRFSIRACI